MKQLTILTFLLILLCISPHAEAQVTVGADEAPLLGALLQLKTEKDVTTSAVTATQGLLLPRVELDMAGSNTSVGSVDKRFLYSLKLTSLAATTGDALKHEGLAIFNLSKETVDNDIFMDNKICPGIYTWTGTQWERSMPDYCE
ncbi:MAG: hypothetical protein E6767_19755 [Dysgonomonas sp.]|nr:hypothetical protein [Dysgonomonas sp.]